MNWLEKFFKLSENRTTVRRELTGGLTTFMTLSYIIFVNPAILSRAGLPFSDTVTATAWVSGLATLLMGVYSNYPFAMACGMGLNAVVAYNIVGGMNLPWQTAMGVIVLEGLVVTALVLTNLREQVMHAIPLPLKRAIGIGIGLFIAFIGMKDAGIVSAHPVTFLTAGNFREPAVWLACAGLVLCAWLMILKVQGALLWGMLMTAGAGLLCSILKLPEQIISVPAFPSTLFQCDVAGALKWQLVPVIFALFMVDFFDTMGTVIAVGAEGGFLDNEGRLPRLKKVLLADSAGAVMGGLFSASSVTTYIESAAGVAQGARTGLSSVVVALLFFLAPVFAPLITVVGGGVRVGEVFLNPVTAPALIMVGFLMMGAVREIEWGNLDESLPVFLIIVGMPLTFSISHGIGFGFISYVLLKTLQGKYREVPLLLYAVSLLFLISFVVS